MNTSFLIWAAAVCLQIILVNSEEQCDIYGRLVEKPGRQCICDQRGVVRCKHRFGGRFLVCVLDMSQLGSNIEKLFDKISEQKRVYRDFVIGEGKVKEKEEKIDEHFDPPDFTMTSRPSIGGGIGMGNVDFGEGEDAAGGETAGEDAAGGDTAGEDAAGDDTASVDTADGGDEDTSGGDKIAKERFRRMKRLRRKPFSKVLRRSRHPQPSRNATKIKPKNARKPRRTNQAARLHKLVAKNALTKISKPHFTKATQKTTKTKYATYKTKPKPITSQQKRSTTT